MRSRLRSLDSRISFFAFADIITAVSGVLIFVALLLATDLGIPTDSRSQAVVTETEHNIQETLAKQSALDAENQRLQAMFAAVDAAPDLAKLKSDIAGLRSQLSEEKKKQSDLNDQIAENAAVIMARDKALGLTELKTKIQSETQAAAEIVTQDAKVREEMTALEQRVAGIQSKLLQLSQRDGKLWLIPDKNGTTKEPILATVSSTGVKLEEFDHPERGRVISKSTASTEFDDYLVGLKPLDQYVVFLVRPSGIGLFETLVKKARDKGLEVGFDALEEDKDVYFSTPPIIDETTPVISGMASQNDSDTGGYSSSGGASAKGADTDGRNGSRSSSANGGGKGSTTVNAGPTGTRYGNASAGSSNQHGTNPQNGSSNAGHPENGGNSPGAKPGGGSGVGEGNNRGNGSSNAPAASSKGGGQGPEASASSTTEPKTNPPAPAHTSAPPQQQKPKSWWQRFLEWIGFR